MAKSKLVSSNVGDVPQSSEVNAEALKDLFVVYTDGTFSVTLRKRENSPGYRPYIVIASSHAVVAKVDNDGTVRGCSFFTNKEHMLPAKHVLIANKTWLKCVKGTDGELIVKQISALPELADSTEVVNFSTKDSADASSEPVVMHRNVVFAV